MAQNRRIRDHTTDVLVRNGLLIRQRRVALGLTQDELAAKLDYESHSAVWKLERVRPRNDAVRIERERFRRLAEVLEMDEGEMRAAVTDESDEPESDPPDGYSSASVGVYVRRVPESTDTDFDGFLNLYSALCPKGDTEQDILRWFLDEERGGARGTCRSRFAVQRKDNRASCMGFWEQTSWQSERTQTLRISFSQLL